MEVKQYLSILWKWSWLIVLSTLVAAAASFWATSQMPRTYMTSTTLMVGSFIQTNAPSNEDFYISQQLARSYLQLVRRQLVLQATVESLGLDMPWQTLAGQTEASLVPATQLIQISVQGTDPQRTKVIADEIARQLILQSPTQEEDQEQAEHRQFVNQRLALLQAQIEEGEQKVEELESRLVLENSARRIQDIQSQMEGWQQKISLWQTNYASLLDFYNGSRTNSLSVVEPAIVPTTPVGPNVKYYVLVAAAIGFTLAAGAAFVLEFLDDTIKTDDDVDRVLGMPTLGTISRIPRVREPSDNLVSMHYPYSPITEVYRVLRTNIQFSSLNNPSPQLLVTSTVPGEGKTTTACNLAITMAYADQRVILVDTDLRRPSVHQFFGTSNQVGLTSLLLDPSLPLEAALIETPVEGLMVMPSGPLPPNPAELLGSEPMKQRLDQMKEWADAIIFDSPPVLAVTDAAVLGTLASGVILVVDAGRTRTHVVRQAKETLDQVNLKILGVVLNRLPPRRSGGYFYYNYYSHARNRRSCKRGSKQPKTATASQIGLLGRLMQPVKSRLTANGRSAIVDYKEEKV